MNSLVVKFYRETEPNRVLEKRMAPHSEEDIGAAMNFLAKSCEVGSVIVLVGAHDSARENRFKGVKKCQWCGECKDVYEKVQIEYWPKERHERFMIVRHPVLGNLARKVENRVEQTE